MMMMTPTRFCLILAAMAHFSSTAMAASRAEELDALRGVAREAHENFQQKNYPKALQQFLEVWSKIKVPAAAYWTGYAYETMGDLGKAAQLYVVATQLAKNELWSDELVQLKAQSDAVTRLNAIKERVPQSLQLELIGGVGFHSVLVDGVELPITSLVSGLPIAAGEHEISVFSENGARVVRRVDVSEHQQAVVTINLAEPIAEVAVAPPSSELSAPPPAPAAAASPNASPTSKMPIPSQTQPLAAKPQQTLRWIAYGSFGVGAAGLLLGASAGLVSVSKYSELKDRCDADRSCPPAVYDAKNDSYGMWRKISTAGFVAGGVGAALGGTLLLMQSHRQRSLSGAVWVLRLGPGAFQVDGAF